MSLASLFVPNNYDLYCNDLNVDGTLTAANFTLPSSITVDNLTVNNTETVNDLTVTGTLTAPGYNPTNINLSGDLTVHGTSDMIGLVTTNDLTVNGTLTAPGYNPTNINLSGDLTVDGTTLLKGMSNFSGQMTANNLTVNGTLTAPSFNPTNINLTGDLTVDGTSTLKGMTNFSGLVTANDLTVNGILTAPGFNPSDINLSGDLTVHGTTLLKGMSNFSGQMTANNLTVNGTLTAPNFSLPGNITLDNLSVTTNAKIQQISEYTNGTGILVGNTLKSPNNSWALYGTGDLYLLDQLDCNSVEAQGIVKGNIGNFIGLIAASGTVNGPLVVNNITCDSYKAPFNTSFKIKSNNGSNNYIDTTETTGILLKTEQGIPSLLNYFEIVDSITMSFVGAIPSTNFVTRIQKLGRVVTLYINRVYTNGNNTNNFILTSDPFLPVRFRPLINVSTVISIVTNTGAANTGALIVRSDGIIIITSTISGGGTFVATTNAIGMSTDANITYMI